MKRPHAYLLARNTAAEDLDMAERALGNIDAASVTILAVRHQLEDDYH